MTMTEDKGLFCRLAEMVNEIDALRIKREIGLYGDVKDGEVMRLRRPKFYDVQIA